MIKLYGVRSELRQGVLDRWKLFLAAMVGAVLLTILFCVDKNKLIIQGRITGCVTIADSLLYFFRGMKEYDPLQDKVFTVVDSYLEWNVFLALVIGSYPMRNLKGIGKQYIIRSKTRSGWWQVKCIWNIVTVTLFYIGIWTGIFVGTLIGQALYGKSHINTFSIHINPSLFRRIFNTEMPQEQSIILMVLLLPFIAALSISMLQMMAMFVCNTAVGYIIVIAYAISSAYWMKDAFIGNAMMVYRYNCVNPDGICWQVTTAVCGILWLFSACLGYFRFKDQNIY